jgi:RNAse (barnase) inhibitor barstar
MTGRLDALLCGRRPAGLYQLPAGVLPGTLVAIARSQGWRTWVLDSARVRDKADFLRECAAVFGFPSWFGHNWDALADCLRDLHPLPAGGVIVWANVESFAASSPASLDTAIEIFTETTRTIERLSVVVVTASPLVGVALL